MFIGNGGIIEYLVILILIVTFISLTNKRNKHTWDNSIVIK